MVDANFGIDVDISFNNYSGLRSTRFVKNLLNDPVAGKRIRPLLLLSKQFLACRQLNEVRSGGLGSLSQLVMISSYLSQLPLTATNPAELNVKTGVLFQGYLAFYGNQFDTSRHGIAFDCKFEKKYTFPKSHSNKICIRDPENESNDMSQGGFRYYQIQHAFAKASTFLENTVNGGKGEAGNILGNVVTIIGRMNERK